MSLFDFKVACELNEKDVSFYGLIMAAMWKADDLNLDKLKTAFPDVWRELQIRYHSPGGLVEGEGED